MINSHIHLFTTDDIPERFLPLRLVRWLAKKDRKVFNFILHNLNPFSDKDELDRYLDFIRTGKLGSQKKIYENIKKNYPKETQFIVLTMDMAYMGAGKVPRAYHLQLDELVELKEIYPEIIPFIHIDTRRSDYFDLLATYVDRGFEGVKLYPPLGVFPYDERFDLVYKYCEKNNLSIISHCTSGNPVHYKGKKKDLIRLLCAGGKAIDASMSKKELCSLFTHPKNYESIMVKYPKLNICLAHFGRGSEWDYIILEMLDKYDNLWVDCSYSMADENNWYKFKLQLITNERLRSRCMFGSDYYMNCIECDEQQWSCKLRVFLGEELFSLISEKNTKNFLKR